MAQLTGEERLSGSGLPAAPATVLHFWQWAFSDLGQNALRGVFAEWMVAKLIGADTTGRDPWDDCDLVTRGGLRIEVKAAAYRQAWHGTGAAFSKIVFSGLHGRRLEGRQYAGGSTYNADLYVFCVLDNRSPDADPLELRNWKFWIMRVTDLARATPNSNQRRSISLASVMREGLACGAAELAAAVHAMEQGR